jgi:hypothetical protein
MIELMLLVLCDPMPDSIIMDPKTHSLQSVSIQDAENFMKNFSE